MSIGLKANNDGSGAVQIGGSDAITISSAGAVAVPQALVGGVGSAAGNYVLNQYTAPATWTKPAALKAVKVTVIGGGGASGTNTTSGLPPTTKIGGAGGAGGNSIYYAPAPAIPGPISITAGPGTNSFGAIVSCTAGASGTNAPPSVPGVPGAGGTATGGTINIDGQSGYPISTLVGGSSLLGFGRSATTGTGYGSGTGSGPGVAGQPGIIIVEEFY